MLVFTIAFATCVDTVSRALLKASVVILFTNRSALAENIPAPVDTATLAQSNYPKKLPNFPDPWPPDQVYSSNTDWLHYLGTPPKYGQELTIWRNYTT